jgi:hypothetical protein
MRQFTVGFCYIFIFILTIQAKNAIAAGQPAADISSVQKTAKKGHAASQAVQASMSSDGQGVPKDDVTEWKKIDTPTEQKARLATAPQSNMTIPIFGERIFMSYPKEFWPAFEKTRGPAYIYEMVLHGETVEKWTQMVTVTGTAGFAAKEGLTPTSHAIGIAGRFERACPSTFNASHLKGIDAIDDHAAFAVVVGCGSLNMNGKTHSETALIITIKGEKNYYTVQWAERGSASSQPVPYDSEKWMKRFNTLMPIILCPVVPGEKAPYPSCNKRMPSGNTKK